MGKKEAGLHPSRVCDWLKVYEPPSDWRITNHPLHPSWNWPAISGHISQFHYETLGHFHLRCFSPCSELQHRSGRGGEGKTRFASRKRLWRRTGEMDDGDLQALIPLTHSSMVLGKDLLYCIWFPLLLWWEKRSQRRCLWCCGLFALVSWIQSFAVTQKTSAAGGGGMDLVCLQWPGRLCVNVPSCEKLFALSRNSDNSLVHVSDPPPHCPQWKFGWHNWLLMHKRLMKQNS